MIPLTVHNDEMYDLFVDVLDLNTSPPNAILAGARINQDRSMQISAQEDGNGQANLQWTATRADDATIVKSDTVQTGINATVDVDVFGA